MTHGIMGIMPIASAESTQPVIPTLRPLKYFSYSLRLEPDLYSRTATSMITIETNTISLVVVGSLFTIDNNIITRNFISKPFWCNYYDDTSFNNNKSFCIK